MRVERIHRIWLLAVGLLAFVLTAQAQCIDFYDLDASYVKCEIGPYAARTGGASWTTQKVDEGPGDQTSRHTVHRSATEVDAQTTFNGSNAGLRTVPEGEVASVRLGNRLDGHDVKCLYNKCGGSDYTGEAERITYTLNVTDENKYILLRYAIIWENPGGHNDLLPSFQIETLAGASGETKITGPCYSYEKTVGNSDLDYVGKSTFNHRICNGYSGTKLTTETHDVAWRDWRTRIINLEDYVGQTVRLRITSSDCGHKGHFGYSYFTLRCLDVNLYSPTCGGPTETRTFTAPTGLNYIWYKVNSSKERTELLSETSNTLTVLNDGQMYECYIASPENSNCHISLYAKAEPRVPMSDFEVDKTESCVDTIMLTDRSCVSRDGVTPLSPHEDVDQVIWDLGDGRVTSVDQTGVKITYAQDGTYTIRQTTRLITGAVTCEDVKERTVTVRGRETKHEGLEYDTICSGDVKTWHGQEYRKTGVYPYTIINGAANGFCDSIVRLNLKVWDSYYRADTVDVLEGKEIPYVWHRDGAPKNLYTSGVYWDSCTTVHGCDSVYKLVMNVRPKYFFLKKDTICEGESYPYHKNGVTVHYTASGTYYDSLLTRTYGNDSVYCLQLHVWLRFQQSETQQFCDGDTVNFHGQRFWTDGPHTVTFTDRHGCDSSYTLILQKQPKYLRDTVASISTQQKPFIWHGKNCYTTGTYFDSLKTVAGCDSVIRLTLTIYPTFFQEDAPLTLCKDSTMKWHTRYLTGSTVGTTVVWDSLKNQYGYDSVYKATLTVLPSYRINRTEQRSIGETYYFFGTPITTGGTYTHYGSTTQGCDSIVNLTITFYPKYYIPETATICKGEVFHYHKNHAARDYNEQGVYWDSLKTVNGYDSVYRLDLKVNPSYHFSESFTICQGDTLKHHGQSFTEANTYVVPFTTKDGCDSVFTLTLRVNPRYEQTIYNTICEGEYVMFAGQSRTKGGIYSDTLKSKQGCDSITHLNLTVNPKLRVHEDVHLCGDDWFYFKGRHITTSGIYSDTLSSGLTGCDSIHSYHVYVHPELRDTTRASICQGEQYMFHGNTFTVGGPHEVIGQSIYGCDSTYVLILTVNPVYRKDTTRTLCHGDNLSLFGRLYTTGGTYVDTLKTHGCNCDSIYTIHINEYAKWFNAENLSLCQGDSYMWHNRLITGAGIYYDSLVSRVSGCDSVYQLTVNMKNTHHTTLVKTILSNDYYDFNGTPLNTSGTYYRHFISERNGCDSLVDLQLTVLPVYDIDEIHRMCQGEAYLWHGQYLTETGTYTDTLKSVHNTDSIVHLALTVYKPIIHTLPTVHISDRETYTWKGRVLSQTGTYDDTVQSHVTLCDSITRLPLVVHPTYHFPVENVTICANQFFTWDKNGSSYNTAGEYVYNPHTYYWGYDSIYTLRLTVGSTYVQSLTAHICEGETYNFFGRPLSEGGFYKDTLPTVSGTCDSIFHLTLVKHAVGYDTRSHAICLGDSYTWAPWEGHSRTLTASGVYFDTLRSAVYGCDSIRYTLNLSTRKPFYEETVAKTCDNQPYTWRGRSYNQTGIYYDSLHSVLAPFCDSVYCLKLQVHPSYEYTLYDTICEGEKREFGGIYYDTGGFYTRSLTTAGSGCDSIIHLSLTVKPITRIEKRVDLCDGEVFRFHGVDYTTSGTYIDTTTSTLVGCDSITTFRVQFHPVIHQTLSAETCEGEGFVFYGQTFYTAGTHTVGGQSACGCDSTYVLTLTVHPRYEQDTTVTLCSGDVFYFNGKPYTTGGVYYDTLHTVHGCDSIYQIRINEYVHSYSHVDVSLCKGDFYDWRGQRITEAGTYRDTVFHTSGCHDVYELAVTLRQQGYREVAATISGATYYDFNGRILRSTGVYYDTLINASQNGCDSIVKLELTVYPEYMNKETARICVGGSYTFNGKQLTESGFYSDTLVSVLGTDSIVELVLTVYSPIYHENVVHISDQETYTWKGHELKQTGTYDSIYTSVVTGCDSIERLKLYVHPTYRFDDYVEMCDDKRLNWHKYSGLIESGTYYDSLLTQTWNNDSVYVLHLTVNPTSRHDTTVHICAGEGYEFGGEVLYNGGYYRDTVSTSAGCNAISTLTLIKHPTYLKEEHKTICEGDYYDWRGQHLSEGNIYEETLPTTTYGCDSVFRLYLSVHHEFYHELKADICEGDYYDFHGRQLNRTGTYWDSAFTSMHHCDSVYRLDLTVHRSVQVERYDTICGTEYTMFGGRAIYAGGLYVDSLLTPHGCDSIVTLHLAHFPVENRRTVREICRGEEVNWTHDGGQPMTVSVAGVYPDTLMSRISGCDSIVELRLAVYNVYYQELSETVCSNEQYNFHGRLLSEPGTYWDSLTTVHTGCDSVYRLDLKVNPSYESSETVYLCDFENYYFAGNRITATGTYYDRLSTRLGCDSTHILHAYVMPSRRDSMAERLCRGETYTFHGTPLTTDGIYRDTLNDPVTRQCIVTTLNLSFLAQSVVYFVRVEDACADDKAFTIHNNYLGARPETYSLLFDAASHEAGFEDIIAQPYTELISAPIPQRDSTSYVRPDYYHARLVLDNSVCVPDSQSEMSLELLLRYPSWIIEQNWNDVVAVLNERYNGGYVFSDYQWCINGNESGLNTPYIYLPQTMSTGDEVVVALTRSGQDYAVPSCPIIIYDKSPELVSEFPVLCGALDAPGRFFIRSAAEGSYTLYSPLGRLMSSGAYRPGDYLEVQTQTAAGCYLLRLTTEAYGTRTVKIILR